MKCIVCDNDIRIDTLKQLFALQPLLLCSRCAHYLIPKSVDVLYEDNDWIRSVVDKLNQGDIALIELFKTPLQKALIKKAAVNFKVKVIKAKDDLPYPWLEILVNSVMKKSRMEALMPSTETLVIAVEKQEDVEVQVSIFGQITTES